MKWCIALKRLTLAVLMSFMIFYLEAKLRLFFLQGYSPHLADKGRIYTYNLHTEELQKLTFSHDFDVHRFWPHGLGVWHDPDTSKKRFQPFSPK